MNSQREHIARDKGLLENSIGAEVRRQRELLHLGVAELARMARMSTGMLSKIEHGLISPSIGTLEALARALRVPIACFFRRFDEIPEVAFTKAGQGIRLDANGDEAGRLELLGIGPCGPIIVEPLLVTLSSERDSFPAFSQRGVVLAYVIEGELTYSYGQLQFPMLPGDALLFDASTFHRIANVRVFPTTLLIVGSYLRGNSNRHS
jgi:transcriptional regulator with XRE-family HTH domain